MAILINNLDSFSSKSKHRKGSVASREVSTEFVETSGEQMKRPLRRASKSGQPNTGSSRSSVEQAEDKDILASPSVSVSQLKERFSPVSKQSLEELKGHVNPPSPSKSSLDNLTRAYTVSSGSKQSLEELKGRVNPPSPKGSKSELASLDPRQKDSRTNSVANKEGGSTDSLSLRKDSGVGKLNKDRFRIFEQG